MTLVVLLVAAGAGAGVAALGTGGTTGAAAPAVASPSPGWNLAGGSLAAQPTEAPGAEPGSGATGSGTTGPGAAGSGRSALAAGDGDFTGFVPAAVRLPSGRRAAVRSAGLHADGSLAVPESPAQVGWWTGGAEPGERYGNVVIAGHVDSARYGLGAFAELLTVRVGARLALEGVGRSAAFEVVSVRRLAKARLAADTAAFDQAGEPRLVLITCGGPFDRDTHRYRDNVVVTAVPVG